MGAAVTFGMVISAMCAYGINAGLTAINAPFLQLISFIVVIASTVQLVEMFIKKASPALFKELGIFLPLITTNCAVLAALRYFRPVRVSEYFKVLYTHLGQEQDLRLHLFWGIRSA